MEKIMPNRLDRGFYLYQEEFEQKAIDVLRSGWYILGNEVIWFKTLSKILCDELGCPPVKFFLPLNLAERIASRMEKKAAKTGEMPMMTTFSVYNLKRNNRFDYSKAERELGYTTRPLEETLRDEAKWLKENGLI